LSLRDQPGLLRRVNVGVEILRGIGCPPGRGAAAHGDVQKFLGSSGDALIESIASDLNSLHSRRNRADYQLDKIDVESTANATAVVKQVDAIIQALDREFLGPKRGQLQAAIQTWRKSNGYP